ncbi:MAG: tol-pal system protein YbgF [Bacteroidota bacterium]
MTIRSAPYLSVWTGAALLAGLFAPAAPAAGPATDARGLPPVVELGAGGTPASPSPTREVMADLLQQIDSLQTEVRNLRGKIEVQDNEIERLKGRQRELFSDIDKRVSDLEHRGAAPAAVGEATPPATTSAPTAQEQQAYDSAFNLLKQGSYDRASKAFKDFIAKYPQSSLRGNAQYWLGQTYYVTRNFRQAREEFGKVSKDNVDADKASDALLKIGYSNYELRDWAKARDALGQVSARYPGSATAKAAEQRLARMKKEGH